MSQPKGPHAANRNSSRHKTRWTWPAFAAMRRGAGAIVATAIAGTMLVVPSVAASGGGTVLLEDGFRDSTVKSSSYITGGTYTPCLTAQRPGGAPVTKPTSCASGATDSEGNGALRLTNAVTSQRGYLLYNHSLPTKAGLDIEFNFYQYGGDGADGISFFLVDGATDLSASDSIGGLGGSLGYHFRNTEPGLKGGLLGIGFDAYGNFGPESNDTSTCGSTHIPSGRRQDSIAVRGPMGANRLSGYCLLAAPQSYNSIWANTSTRSGALRQARIILDPPTEANPRVKVYVKSNQGASWDLGSPVVNVAQPAILNTTPTFKFGWAASTGGSTNIHEINFLQVSSVIEIHPELTLSSTGSNTTADGVTTLSYTTTV